MENCEQIKYKWHINFSITMKELCHLGKAGILKVISLHLFTALVEGRWQLSSICYRRNKHIMSNNLYTITRQLKLKINSTLFFKALMLSSTIEDCLSVSACVWDSCSKFVRYATLLTTTCYLTCTCRCQSCV